MNKTVYILDMFSKLIPDEALQPLLQEAVVRHAEIDQTARRIAVTLECGRYLSQRTLDGIAAQLERVYGIKSVILTPRYPARLLQELDFSELNQVIIRQYSMAAATLAGAQWTVLEDKLLLQLKGNGIAELRPHLQAAERYIKERFGVDRPIEVTAGSDLSAQELFEQTEKLRKTAVASLDLPEPAPEHKKVQQSASGPSDAIYGKPFKGEPTPMQELSLDMFKVVVEGEVFAVNHRELKKRNAWVICFDMTDYTGSVRINQFMENAKAKPILENIQPGMWIQVLGKMSFDRYDNEMVMQPMAIMAGQKPARKDTAPEKRVELHLHTVMSSMDALTDTAAAVKQAAKWGHRAIAITDHGVCQSFPDAMKAAGKAKVAGTDEPIKILYGCEAYFVNDVDDRIVVHGATDAALTDEFVAFDLETTGLSAQTEEITEIGAAIYKNGEILDQFQTFVNPGKPLSQRIIDLTGITDDMLADAPTIAEVLPKFLEFCGERPLAAHNADFDVGFIRAACHRLGIDYEPTYIDTLIMAQNLMPELGKYKLNIVADALSLPEFNHHRAVDDGMTVAHMLRRFFAMLEEKGVKTVQEINPLMATLRSGGRLSDRHARHMIIFAKNQTGPQKPVPPGVLLPPALLSAGTADSKVGTDKMARGSHHWLRL